MPLVTVVVPVYNRDHELRRALRSVQRQTHRDFECLVVDDASEMDIAAIVEQLDDSRFRCIRRATNGGPTIARNTAFAEARGDYALTLDSDWELYPWVLDQGVRRLAEHPSVNIACALHLRHEDGTLFVRVNGGERVITPAEFRTYEPAPDRVAMVRRSVVELWLSIPGEYFALESGYWITAELAHSSLALDEPWTRYHTSSGNRVTPALKTEQGRERQLRDYVTFLEARRELIECGPCVSVDRLLEGIHFQMVRAKHPSAGVAAAALASRGLVPRSSAARQLLMRVEGKLRRTPRVHWV
jgi:glycosyltransferase involved in cell wall biosynthesis